jgi:hypothetical protein
VFGFVAVDHGNPFDGDDSEYVRRCADLHGMRMMQAHKSTRTLFCVFAWTFSIVLTSQSSASPAPPKDSNYTLELEPFAEHAGKDAIDLTHANDNSGRIFVSTMSGQVFAFDRDGKALGVFLDIAASRPDFILNPSGAFRGLMYIAFHPDYAVASRPGYGRFYTGHQITISDSKPAYDSRDHGAMGDSDVRFVLAEWRVDADNPDRIDPASYRPVMLLNFHTTASNPHAVGELKFNPYATADAPDYGQLYIAIGDSNNRNESGHTNLAYTQRTDNPFAKILRIDPLPDGDRAYGIPPDNPFGNEVYAIGMRNSQTFSFAKDLDGKPVIVAFDSGASAVEEVNIIRAGNNYGWDRYEGTQDFDTGRKLHSPPQPPAVQYGHHFQKRPGEDPVGGAASIIGGFVVSDPEDPSFKGQIIFADLPRGTLMHANYHHALKMQAEGRQSLPYVMDVQLGDKIGTLADVLGAERGDSRFGVDQAGTLYVVSKQTNTIFKTKLVYTGEPVQAEPGISKQNALGGIPGLIVVIGGTGLGLLCLLIVVVLMSKRKPI